jgi:hypothetical protein
MKVKKFLFALATVALVGVLSCNACTKHDTVISPGQTCADGGCPWDGSVHVTAEEASVVDAVDSSSVDSSSVDRVITGATWEATVPADWESKTDGVDVQTQAVVYHPSDKELIMVLREKYDGVVEGYAIEALRGIKGAKADVVSAKSTSLNGINFTLIESKKDNVTVWAWVTVKDGFGYVFTCGGDASQLDLHRNSCNNIALTFKIK